MESFELNENFAGKKNGILCVECSEPMKTLFHFCGLHFFYKRNASGSNNSSNRIGVRAKKNNRTDNEAYQHFRIQTFDRNFHFHKNKIVFAADYLPDNLNPYLSYIHGRYILLYDKHRNNDLDFVCCKYHQ